MSKANRHEFTSTWSLYQLKNESSTTDTNTQEMLSSEIAARSILQAIDARDHYTYGHSIRVAHYCLILGQYLELSIEKLYELELSALFHDIGKITVPLNILCKPSGLTNEEFKIMKKHPEMSFEILNAFKGFKQIAKNAKHHHEHYNGKGYPDKLAQDQIPFNARIILIADTYDAITSSRVYREGMNPEIAFEELIQFSGTQFDPKLASTFVEAMRQFQQSQKQGNVVPLFPVAAQKKAA